MWASGCRAAEADCLASLGEELRWSSWEAAFAGVVGDGISWVDS
jgi:hypothetical protein